MEYNFIEEEKRFYHLSKSINTAKIKDPEVKDTLKKLHNMIHIMKELYSNERRRFNKEIT